MEQIHLTEAQKLKLLDTSEGHFLDFKSVRISPAKASQSISAFANADGGELFIGIEDAKIPDNRWAGFPDQEAANAFVAVFTGLYPSSGDFSYEFLSADGGFGLVLRIEILKNRQIWSDTSKDFYIRRGAQNLKLDHASLRRIEYDKGLHSFEDQKLEVDFEFLEKDDTLSGFIDKVVPTATAEAWLRKQRLIVDNALTVAGCLLFSDEPQIVVPKAAVKIYRYQTSEAPSRESLEGNPESIEGSAYDQIKNSVNRVVEIVEKIPIMGESGFEAIRYPHDALHEIITNAVIHRDYSANDDIHIRIFNNRIEIYSPGKLPGHITPTNILDERLARNQKLVRILNKFPDPPNKDVGEGLNTAFAAMRALQLRDPEVIDSPHGVLILLKHEKLATPEQKIVEFLRENEEINNTQARLVTFIGSENTVKRIFQKMISAQIIESIPDRAKRHAAYRRGAKFPAD